MALPTASDNPFPSLLITEGTEPAAPAAGKQRLYIDSTTHKLKRTDSSGTDVTIESTAAASDGWVDDSAETWTYAAADSPTFTFTVPTDLTAKYTPGMRLKLTQTTVKYFIVTAVSYSAPNTTITVYGGTDYTLANAAISVNYHSPSKAPAGFPLDPAKWTVEFTDTANQVQNSPASFTWYNLGSTQISLPIGSWRIWYEVILRETLGSAGAIEMYVALSTTNNGASDRRLVGGGMFLSAMTSLSAQIHRERHITVAAKTAYFLNMMTPSNPVTYIAFNPAIATLGPTTVIAAVCAYL